MFRKVKQVQHSACLFVFLQELFIYIGGDVAREVRAVAWQAEGCRFDPTLGVSKCP